MLILLVSCRRDVPPPPSTRGRSAAPIAAHTYCLYYQTIIVEGALDTSAGEDKAILIVRNQRHSRPGCDFSFSNSNPSTVWLQKALHPELIQTPHVNGQEQVLQSHVLLACWRVCVRATTTTSIRTDLTSPQPRILLVEDGVLVVRVPRVTPLLEALPDS
jgi:hypothetical protein